MSGLPASGELPRTIAIDAHAHLRGCFELSSALDHAAANLGRGLAGPGSPAGMSFLGVLLLAQARDCHPFEELAERVSSPWSVTGTGEEISLYARNQSGATLLLVAGRQVTTLEQLEVLSLGSTGRLEEGASLETTLGMTREGGGLAVLPWGFGKWWGRRGEIVRRIVATARPGEFFLGDNGNRPQGTPRPALFREAEARGLGVLPGSDPLPFPAHLRNLGRYGFVLSANLDREGPAENLKRVIRRGPATPATIGGREGPLRFVRDQIRLRVG
ncbi:MAG TPA: hypothetical protein VJP59_07350 [Gemmatimonadota bacterium]|nr:hypothetical protein [Gemmatimonadota bacterium]